MENARRAAFSFFPKRSGGCAPEAFVVAKQPSAALSVTRRTFRHMTCGALAAFWKVEMFLSRCGADAPGKNERVAPRPASLPLWARIPRVYISNNELERAKDAICERPLTAPDYSTKLSFEPILSKHTRFTYRLSWLCLKYKPPLLGTDRFCDRTCTNCIEIIFQNLICVEILPSL